MKDKNLYLEKPRIFRCLKSSIYNLVLSEGGLDKAEGGQACGD